MKLTHLSHTDSGSGAGRAAYRIHRSLLDAGVCSRMLVGRKRTSDPTVFLPSKNCASELVAQCSEYWEARAGNIISGNEEKLFSPASLRWSQIKSDRLLKDADLIAMYWINGGFVSPEVIQKIQKPLVWRLSDAWPFTGGCHYPGDCLNFISECGQCPQVKWPKSNDYSHSLLLRKKEAWSSVNLTIAAPSQWIANLASRSALFSNRRIEVIPTGIDVETFYPIPNVEARKRWGLPQKKFIVVFGAMNAAADKRKGFDEFKKALCHVAGSQISSQVLAVVFGSDDLPLTDMAIPTISLGRLNSEEDLAAAYSCADVFVLPSHEDNLPNVAIEALACGAPIVAFDIGGLRDIVKNSWNGELVAETSVAKLGIAIVTLLSNKTRLAEMSANSRLHAEANFSLTLQTKKYQNLFSSVLDEARKNAI